MPEISRFFGIVVRMFAEDKSVHHRPHFHVYYQEHEASYALDPIELLNGSLPIRQRRLVEAWAELHLEELLGDWKLLMDGKPAKKIEPLEK
jgi:hypothetical protein